MKLICVFVFAYAKRWFSHDAAHYLLMMKVYKSEEFVGKTEIITHLFKFLSFKLPF